VNFEAGGVATPGETDLVPREGRSSSAVVRSVEEGERRRASSIQLLAFAADPVIRWLWPESDAFVRHFPELVEAFGGRAFDSRTAHVTEDFHGAALWLPPGVGPDDEALEHVALGAISEPKRSQLLSIFDEMSASTPQEPHWHLAFIGVDPYWHGQGIGSALLQHALSLIDEARRPAYLESSNPRNLSLYERHGFEVIREIRVRGAPPLFPMLRPSR
jgi:GNAT superfamily N-acetyltransferase